MPAPSIHALTVALLSAECRCGRIKRSRQAFCSGCYRALPIPMQKALYRRIGQGYEEAYAAAVRELKGDDGEQR